MASRKHALVAGTTLWFAVSWIASFSCFTQDPTSDAGDSEGGDATLDAGCTSPFGGCSDAAPIDPCDSGLSLALRTRALFDKGCWGGPERGCHSEFAGNNLLLIDQDSGFSGYPYATYGLIDIPSSERPDVIRVVPFDPASSYLYWKVSGDPRIADGSGIMPLSDSTNADSGAVVQCYAALIHAWIEAGAP